MLCPLFQTRGKRNYCAFWVNLSLVVANAKHFYSKVHCSLCGTGLCRYFREYRQEKQQRKCIYPQGCIRYRNYDFPALCMSLHNRCCYLGTVGRKYESLSLFAHRQRSVYASRMHLHRCGCCYSSQSKPHPSASFKIILQKTVLIYFRGSFSILFQC